jgi:hypothetical protein
MRESARWWRRSSCNLDAAGHGQKLEPEQWIAVGTHRCDPALGQTTDRSQCPDRGTGLDRGCCRAPECQLRRRVVPMATWIRAALGSEDALFLEVAQHSRRGPERAGKRADSGRFVERVEISHGD